MATATSGVLQRVVNKVAGAGIANLAKTLSTVGKLSASSPPAGSGANAPTLGTPTGSGPTNGGHPALSSAQFAGHAASMAEGLIKGGAQAATGNAAPGGGVPSISDPAWSGPSDLPSGLYT